MIVLVSLMWVLHKDDMKLRLYEDDEETSVLDLNNAINRRKNKTITMNYYSHYE